MKILLLLLFALCSESTNTMYRLGGAALDAVDCEQRQKGRVLYLFVRDGMLPNEVTLIFPTERPTLIGPFPDGRTVLLWFDHGVYVHVGLNGRVCGKFLLR